MIMVIDSVLLAVHYIVASSALRLVAVQTAGVVFFAVLLRNRLAREWARGRLSVILIMTRPNQRTNQRESVYV